jgi:hypothetical protein
LYELLEALNKSHFYIVIIMEIERINALSNQLTDLRDRIEALWGYL